MCMAVVASGAEDSTKHSMMLDKKTGCLTTWVKHGVPSYVNTYDNSQEQWKVLPDGEHSTGQRYIC